MSTIIFLSLLTNIILFQFNNSVRYLVSKFYANYLSMLWTHGKNACSLKKKIIWAIHLIFLILSQTLSIIRFMVEFSVKKPSGKHEHSVQKKTS